MRCYFYALRSPIAVAHVLFALIGATQSNSSTNTTPTSPMTKCMLSGPVGSVIVQQDGKIVIAGGGNIFFATPEAGIIGSLNGTVARFHPNGSLDYGFGCRAEPPNYVSAFDSHLSVRPDGRLLMTGIFKKVDGEPING